MCYSVCASVCKTDLMKGCGMYTHKREGGGGSYLHIKGKGVISTHTGREGGHIFTHGKGGHRTCRARTRPLAIAAATF